MTNPSFPSETPNVGIADPKVRIALRTILDVIGGLAFIAVAVDVSSAAFDIVAFTTPVLAGYAAARVVFGFAVDTRNTPKS